ncbi:hypothetical protein HGRIS_005496 [Hohenbuehelia grisea]|uniref:Uncharacterized protein n=1 Tax=Hohenbuehelia grisea TaxID=104357 RepID=A0ABR3JWZ3_9AGAR
MRSRGAPFRVVSSPAHFAGYLCAPRQQKAILDMRLLVKGAASLIIGTHPSRDRGTGDDSLVSSLSSFREQNAHRRGWPSYSEMSRPTHHSAYHCLQRFDAIHH